MPLFLGCVLVLLFFQILPQNLAVAAPFLPGEKASYQVRWSFVVGGQVDIAVEKNRRFNDLDAWHFSLAAKTYPYVDLFYKVRERIDSYTDKGINHSLFYSKVEKGKNRRDIKVSFDWQTNEAIYQNFDEKPRTVKIEEGTFDPLSVYFFLRTRDIGRISSMTRPVTDGKTLVLGTAKILRRESIAVPAGHFDTYVVEPDMKKVQGVFEKSKNARLLVWLTADSRHLMVRAESKVVVGSIVAELISLSRAEKP
jgi:hypothetical protein